METENGWHSSSTIHGNSTRIGCMICKACDKEILSSEKWFLETTHYNAHHRGNETQFNELFHKNCSIEHPEWKKRSEVYESARKERVKNLETELLAEMSLTKKRQDEISKEINPFN